MSSDLYYPSVTHSVTSSDPALNCGGSTVGGCSSLLFKWPSGSCCYYWSSLCSSAIGLR